MSSAAGVLLPAVVLALPILAATLRQDVGEAQQKVFLNLPPQSLFEGFCLPYQNTLCQVKKKNDESWIMQRQMYSD
jgi:hypothetical protein